MKLADLAACLPEKEISGPIDLDITTVVCNSQKVIPGALFFCLKGQKTDGHRFLVEAVKKGAVAAVVSQPVEAEGITLLRVPDGRRAMALLAACFYGRPAEKLRLIGVTGTNGKSTSAILIEELLRRSGRKTGLIGTILTRIGERVLPATLTTPDSPDLQRLLAEMLREGVEDVSMEVSSHSLVMDRVFGCPFRLGAFTNLTQDHLDFHGTMEAYFEAKLRLFESLAPGGIAVVNGDDPAGIRIGQMTRAKVLSYGLGAGCEVRAANIRTRLEGTHFTLSSPWGTAEVRLRLIGLFNVYNSLTAVTSALALGLSLKQIEEILPAIPPVRGRFETVSAGQDFTVVVDYAHTPDGLSNVLKAARALSPRKLIVVFGCGGDRDRTKRSLMGREAATLADLPIVTSDNPRTEDPLGIIREIEKGVEGRGVEYLVEPDRREAIRLALSRAVSGDLVLIAGKGHEDYQIFRERTIHFDDAEVVREILSGGK